MWAGLALLLSSVIVPLVVKVMLAVGIGFVTYTGVNLLLDQVRATMVANFVVPVGFEQVLNLLAFMNADRAITMILSAITIRATMRGLQASGSLRRFGILPGA